MIESVAADSPRVAAGRWSVLVRAVRVRQWPKNLLVFAGLLFAAKIGDGTRWLEAVTVFAAYTIASIAAYLVNDVQDAPRDRLHPAKRHRPVASGALNPRAALAVAAALVSVALLLASLLELQSLLLLLLFVVLQVAYSFRLKEVVGIDVVAIAALFVVRAAAGAEAVEVPISRWLLACTALLALFLALAKRRGELLRGGEEAAAGRTALARYSRGRTERLLVAAAVATVISYSVYAFTAHDSIKLAATVPFVVFALARYIVLIHRDGVGEEPETVLLTDLPILATAFAWAILATVLLSL